MTDDLDLLKAALKAAPKAGASARAAALARAMAAFDENSTLAQEQRPLARPNPVRPRGAGFVKGLREMLSHLSLKPMLAATTSAAALGLVLVAVLPQVELGPQGRDAAPREEAEAPMAEVAPMAEPALVPVSPAPPAPPAQRKAGPQSEVAGALMADAPEAASGVMASRSIEGDAVADMAFAAAPMAIEEGRALRPEENTEAFANTAPNPVRVTAEEPVSTFSADVDTASYAILRSSLMAGMLPDPHSVRIEEMVNYFPYAYPGPDAGEAPFRPSIAVIETPWNPGTRLVRIGLQGRLPVVAARPPLNLVFLIDTSGSMEDPAKLPLLKQSLGLMLAELRPEDEVAIVAYAGSAGEVLPPTPALDRGAILAAMDRLAAGGGTDGGAGLELAYRTAARMTQAGEVSRVLLATDGDFNLGISDPAGLEAYVAQERSKGIYLSVLGFGRGNLDDQVMQALAQNGNGTAAYIDTLQEARKVLVDQLAGALFPIADDVKIQVEWNPAEVAEYRLLGYETRALRREDFNNDRVDAGEVGAGHQVTALYEIAAPGSAGLRIDPLRYGGAEETGAETGAEETVAPVTEAGAELGFLRLRYKAPGEVVSGLIETPILAASGADDEARFAAAIAGFGELLRGSSYLEGWGWDQAIALAEENRGEDPFGYRIEAVNLMRLARDLAR